MLCGGGWALGSDGAFETIQGFRYSLAIETATKIDPCVEKKERCSEVSACEQHGNDGE